ncbi:hypothetical protein ACS0PU_008057 [Formica fusca]
MVIIDRYYLLIHIDRVELMLGRATYYFARYITCVNRQCASPIYRGTSRNIEEHRGSSRIIEDHGEIIAAHLRYIWLFITCVNRQCASPIYRGTSRIIEDHRGSSRIIAEAVTN